MQDFQQKVQAPFAAAESSQKQRYYLCTSTKEEPTRWTCAAATAAALAATAHNTKWIEVDARIPVSLDVLFVTHDLKPQIAFEK
jgi:hypothetical protein